jgi:hypothetical protein
MEQIYSQHWVSLPKEVRVHLISVFGLVRTGVTEVINQEVKSDGFTNDDLKGITLEKMNGYIGSTETFARAWELTLSKVNSELHPPVGEITETNHPFIPAEAIIPEAQPVVLKEEDINPSK